MNDFRFSTEIHESDFILSDHRVYDNKLMPGVTFIDIIYRALKIKEINLKQVLLKNIIFHKPVWAPKNQSKKIIIDFISCGPFYKVNAYSIFNKEKENNFSCEIYFFNELLLKFEDFSEFKQNAYKIQDINVAYSYANSVSINHFNRMKCLGQIYKGGDSLLIEAILNKYAKEYNEYFYINPVFLDTTTLCAFLVFNKKEIGVDPFIPVHIESFHCVEQTDSFCYAYINSTKVKKLSEDLLSFSLDLYNSNGSIIANITKMAVKRIRSKELIDNIVEVKDRIRNKEGYIQNEISFKPNMISDEVNDIKKDNDLEKIKNILKQEIIKVTGTNSINNEENFYKQGLDSVELMQVVSSLEVIFNLQLYPTLLFEYNNINLLASFLLKKYGSIIKEIKN